MKYTSPLIKEILKSESAKRALDRISPIYMDSKIGLWMLESIGTELDELRSLTQDMATQILPQTTTWAIDYWEKEYGISVNKDLPLEQIRRPRLLSKIRARAPMNPAKLVSLIKTEINNQSIPIEITENVHKNTFRIMITPSSFHTNWKQVFKLVDRVKPAHVIYFIIMYDLSKFYVPIEMNSILNILSDFYVRKGNYPWYLNGNIFIDGNFYLNGYKDSEIIDYYPLNLLIRDYVDVYINFLWRLKYPSNFIVDIDESSRLGIISDFEVWHIPNHLYIDGSWQIDGKYNLNGYYEDIYPDYYPLDLLVKDYVNVDINLLQRLKYPSNSLINIDESSKLGIISDFEVRPIQNHLYIDGSWKIDGKYNLNGYYEDIYHDYYPLNLLIRDYINTNINATIRDKYSNVVPIALKQSSILNLVSKLNINPVYKAISLMVKSNIKSNINLSTTLKNSTDYAVETRYDTHSKFINQLNTSVLFSLDKIENKSECTLKVEYSKNSALTVNRNLWHLDGSACLDGDYGLNPAIIIYNI